MRRTVPLSLLVSFLISAGVHAHPISISDTVIDVTPTEVKVRLRLMLEDLVYYYSLEADDQFKYPDDGFRKAARDHLTLLRIWGEIASDSVSELPIFL